MARRRKKAGASPIAAFGNSLMQGLQVGLQHADRREAIAARREAIKAQTERNRQQAEYNRQRLGINQFDAESRRMQAAATADWMRRRSAGGGGGGGGGPGLTSAGEAYLTRTGGPLQGAEKPDAPAAYNPTQPIAEPADPQYPSGDSGGDTYNLSGGDGGTNDGTLVNARGGKIPHMARGGRARNTANSFNAGMMNSLRMMELMDRAAARRNASLKSVGPIKKVGSTPINDPAQPIQPKVEPTPPVPTGFPAPGTGTTGPGSGYGESAPPPASYDYGAGWDAGFSGSEGWGGNSAEGGTGYSAPAIDTGPPGGASGGEMTGASDWAMGGAEAGMTFRRGGPVQRMQTGGKPQRGISSLSVIGTALGSSWFDRIMGRQGQPPPAPAQPQQPARAPAAGGQKHLLDPSDPRYTREDRNEAWTWAEGRSPPRTIVPQRRGERGPQQSGWIGEEARADETRPASSSGEVNFIPLAPSNETGSSDAPPPPQRGGGGRGGGYQARGGMLGDQRRTTAYDPTKDRMDPRNVGVVYEEGQTPRGLEGNVNPMVYAATQHGGIELTHPSQRTFRKGGRVARFQDGGRYQQGSPMINPAYEPPGSGGERITHDTKLLQSQNYTPVKFYSDANVGKRGVLSYGAGVDPWNKGVGAEVGYEHKFDSGARVGGQVAHQRNLQYPDQPPETKVGVRFHMPFSTGGRGYEGGGLVTDEGEEEPSFDKSAQMYGGGSANAATGTDSGSVGTGGATAGGPGGGVSDSGGSGGVGGSASSDAGVGGSAAAGTGDSGSGEGGGTYNRGGRVRFQQGGRMPVPYQRGVTPMPSSGGPGHDAQQGSGGASDAGQAEADALTEFWRNEAYAAAELNQQGGSRSGEIPPYQQAGARMEESAPVDRQRRVEVPPPQRTPPMMDRYGRPVRDTPVPGTGDAEMTPVPQEGVPIPPLPPRPTTGVQPSRQGGYAAPEYPPPQDYGGPVPNEETGPDAPTPGGPRRMPPTRQRGYGPGPAPPGFQGEEARANETRPGEEGPDAPLRTGGPRPPPQYPPPQDYGGPVPNEETGPDAPLATHPGVGPQGPPAPAQQPGGPPQRRPVGNGRPAGPPDTSGQDEADRLTREWNERNQAGGGVGPITKKGAVDTTAPMAQGVGEPQGGYGLAGPGQNLSTNNAARDYLGAATSFADWALKDAGPQRKDEATASLYSGKGAASAEEIGTVFMAVDPDGKMPLDKRLEAGAKALHDFYIARNDPKGAAQAVFQVAQYGVTQSRQHGAAAVKMVQAGNEQGALKELMAGYSWLVDGGTARVDGQNIVVTGENGKVRAQIPLQPGTIQNLSMGMMSGQLGWDAIRRANNANAGPPPAPAQAVNASYPAAGNQPPGPSAPPAQPSAAPAGPAAPPAAPTAQRPPTRAINVSAPQAQPATAAPTAAPVPAPRPSASPSQTKPTGGAQPSKQTPYPVIDLDKEARDTQARIDAREGKATEPGKPPIVPYNPNIKTDETKTETKAGTTATPAKTTATEDMEKMSPAEKEEKKHYDKKPFDPPPRLIPQHAPDAPELRAVNDALVKLDRDHARLRTEYQTGDDVKAMGRNERNKLVGGRLAELDKKYNEKRRELMEERKALVTHHRSQQTHEANVKLNPRDVSVNDDKELRQAFSDRATKIDNITNRQGKEDPDKKRMRDRTVLRYKVGDDEREPVYEIAREIWRYNRGLSPEAAAKHAVSLTSIIPENEGRSKMNYQKGQYATEWRAVGGNLARGVIIQMSDGTVINLDNNTHNRVKDLHQHNWQAYGDAAQTKKADDARSAKRDKNLGERAIELLPYSLMGPTAAAKSVLGSR